MDTNFALKKLPNKPAWAVSIDRKVVGEIRFHTGRLTYQYFPKGSAKGGEEFTTLAACEHSLRGD